MTPPGSLRLAGRDIRAEIGELGASLHRLQARVGRDKWQDLILSRDDVRRNDGSYFGATIGRLANRTAGGRLQLDGREHQLTPNEGPNHLHGGSPGFADLPWTVANLGEGRVRLRLVSPDGDQGYPGQLLTFATFTLTASGLRVVYFATSNRPTVVNLTLHPYFNLDGAATIEDHVLSVRATRYTPTGEDHIPTGEIAAVEGTALDLRRPRPLRETLADLAAQGLSRAGGLNHNLVVDGSGLREHARLSAPGERQVIVRSDAPAVQLYSAGHLGAAGLAIEPQGFPDAPNHPEFPSVVLRPGRAYTRVIEFVVSQAPPDRHDG
jgi:aldose 1-epimerase